MVIFPQKKRVLAAFPDVQTMSKLVKNFLSLSNTTTLLYVMISYPRIAALYEGDINDMVEYLGLPKLKGLYDHPWEAYAAYAVHGLGLCERFEDNEQ
jgi:hypothetical protein